MLDEELDLVVGENLAHVLGGDEVLVSSDDLEGFKDLILGVRVRGSL